MFGVKSKWRLVFVGAVWAAVLGLVPATGHAQAPDPPRKGPCGAGMVEYRPPVQHKSRFRRVADQRAQVSAGQLRIDFIGHSSFLITSPAGVTAVTDFNDNFRADLTPDIVTMSGWHPNHMSVNIDPATELALPGWIAGRGIPPFDATIKDLRVYAVPINVSVGGRRFMFPSAVFVFQSGDLCVAHLGLIAHTVGPQLAAAIGRVDVVMTPVDQRVTQSLEEIIHNIREINPRIVIPMHYNAEATVQDFLAGVEVLFPIKRIASGSLVLEKATLPQSTEVYYLVPPYFGQEF